MSNIFRSAETLAQNEAINEYASSLRSAEARKEKEQEGINQFNDILTGVTGAVGGVIGIKPAEKVVQAGLRKALGFGAKQVEQKITDKLSSLVNGDSEFMNKLPSNVSRGIQSVLQDNPPQSVVNAFNNLNPSARDSINKARDRLGKAEIRNTEAPQPTSTDTGTTAQSDPGSTATDANDLTTADQARLQQVNDANQELADRYNALPRESQLAVRDDIRNDPGFKPGANSSDDIIQNQDLARMKIADEEQRLGQTQQFATEGDRPTAEQGADAPTQPENMGREGSPHTGSGGDASEPAQVNDVNQAGQANIDSTSTPSATAGTDATTATEGSDAIDGLSGVADTLDAVAGATGGLDIFADLLAGIASLATIIGGEAGRKAPAELDSTPVSSGIQFGV